MTEESVDDIPPADESYLSIHELIAYTGARTVEALEGLGPDTPLRCCGHAFATVAAWLQHRRVVHPMG